MRAVRAAPLLALLSALAACKRSGEAPDAGAELALPPRIDIRADRTDLVFSYPGPEGALVDVDKLEKVPAASRHNVLVRDLSRSAEELQADKYLYVADLSAPAADGGSYDYALVSRWAFDKKLPQLVATAAVEAVVADGGSAVTIYGTSWCGACAAARRFFKSNKVPFVDHDIEREPEAEREMMAKAKRAGLSVSGVPVIDAGGQLMLGFDEGRLRRILGIR